MRDLLLVGAGGFGREVFHLAQRCIGHGKTFRVKGFIDDNLGALDSFEGYPPIIGTTRDLHSKTGESVFMALGNNEARARLASSLSSCKHDFFPLIHETARISGRLNCGEGCLIGPLVSIGADASVGSFVLLQTGVIVGHDVTVESYCRVDNYAVLIAQSTVKTRASIHSSAVINGKVTVRESATVGAASFVVRNVRAGSTVIGNPAKEL